MTKVIGHAVCVIIQNKEGKILAVSRKDNFELFGLPGGKVDTEDGTNYSYAVFRETKEETGLDLYEIKELDVRDYSLNPAKLRTQHCFVANYKGGISSREELDAAGEFGIVKWLDKEDIKFYEDYNKLMFNKAGV